MNDYAHLRVLGISGSLRKASFNTGLLRAAQEIASEPVEITLFDIRELPFYDGDVEAQGDPRVCDRAQVSHTRRRRRIVRYPRVQLGYLGST